MTATQVNESGWAAILFGAVALWAGWRILARPRDTHDALVKLVEGGRQIPAWARPAYSRTQTKTLGLVVAAVGAGLLALGVVMLLTSRA